MRNARAAFAALAAAGTLWGLGFVFGKIALSTMPVGAMVAWRFIAASAVLLPFALRRSALPLLKPRTLIALTIAATLYVPVQFLIQFRGLALTSVTHASLVVAILPGLIALGSLAVLRQRLNATTLLAIALSIAGAVIIVARPDRTASVEGDALVALSLLAAVAWVLFTQRYLREAPPVEMTALTILIGTISLIAIDLIVAPNTLVAQYPPTAWLAVTAAGIFSTAASTVLWNVGLRTIDAQRAGVFLNLEPLVGAVCGVLFFSDPFGPTLFVGAALVLGGAYIVTSA